MGQVTAFPLAASAPPLDQLQTGQEDKPNNLSPIQSPAAVYLAGLQPVTRVNNRGRRAELLVQGTWPSAPYLRTSLSGTGTAAPPTVGRRLVLVELATGVGDGRSGRTTSALASLEMRPVQLACQCNERFPVLLLKAAKGLA